MPIRIRRPVKDPVIIRGRRIYNLALYSAYSILKRMQKLGYVVRSKNDLYITEYGSNVLINHEMNNLDKE